MSQYEKMFLIPKSLYNVYLQSNSPIKDEMSSVYVRQLNRVNVNINGDSKNEDENTNMVMPAPSHALDNNIIRSEREFDTSSKQLGSESFQPMQPDKKNLQSNVVYNNQMRDADERKHNDNRPYPPIYLSSSTSPSYVPPNIINNTYTGQFEREGERETRN